VDRYHADLRKAYEQMQATQQAHDFLLFVECQTTEEFREALVRMPLRNSLSGDLLTMARELFVRLKSLAECDLFAIPSMSGGRVLRSPCHTRGRPSCIDTPSKAGTGRRPPLGRVTYRLIWACTRWLDLLGASHRIPLLPLCEPAVPEP